MTTPQPMGHMTSLHMPVIAPPPAGTDAATHYKAVLAATSVNAGPTANSGLEVTISNPAQGKLFAIAGGELRFIPPGQPLPTAGKEPSPGAGSLCLETWADDILYIKKKLPGVPPMLRVLYLGVRPDTVRAALEPFVATLDKSELDKAWNQGSPVPSDRALVQQNFLNRVVQGTWRVLVPGGTPLGEPGHRDPKNPAAGGVFTLRLVDSAGADMSPVVHIRSMQSLDPARWAGHPLIAQVADIVVPVDIHLQFEVWESGDIYRPLPASVTVELMDYDPELPDVVLATEVTDSQGRVHFAIHNLQAVDESLPDLYFRVKTNKMHHAGHTLPDEWSTKGPTKASTTGWLATDGSKGYYESFAGMRLGEASAPLVFRIGLDFHARLVYEHVPIATLLENTTISGSNGSKTLLVAGVFPPNRPWWSGESYWDELVRGMTLRVEGDTNTYVIGSVAPLAAPSLASLTLDRPYGGPNITGKKYSLFAPAPPQIPVSLYASGIEVAKLRTDNNGGVHGILFNVPPKQHFYFEVRFETEDASINLKRAYVATSYAAMDTSSWQSSYNDIDRVEFTDSVVTTLGSVSSPILLRCSAEERNVALYLLKCLRELHVFLFRITGGVWKGVPLRLTRWAPVESYSWPVGVVNMKDHHYWNRGVIIHEISHQLMWEEVNYSTLGIAYQELFGSLVMKHDANIMYSRQLALVEGWAEFVQQIFQPVTDTDTHFSSSREVKVNPPYISQVRGIVSLTHATDEVANTDHHWNLSRLAGVTFHVEGENTWYRVMSYSFPSPPSLPVLKLDRPYEGSTRNEKAHWIYTRIIDLRAGNVGRQLFPFPGTPLDGAGESVEGCFANGLWNIFFRHVVTAVDADVPESLNGDVTATAPWLTKADVQKRFLDMIWHPLRDLRYISDPTSSDMLARIQAHNLSNWHILRASLQACNMAAGIPSVSSVVPASGRAAGGQRVTITGDNFVLGADVIIGGNPAVNVLVTSSTTLVADTPPGAAGLADVVVRTLSGAGTLKGGYSYL